MMHFSSFTRGVVIDITPVTINDIMLLINSAIMVLSMVKNNTRD